MNSQEILALLTQVQAGGVTPEQALEKLQVLPYSDIGYAKVDHHRQIRKGAAEVIYGEGKSAEQIIGILEDMARHKESSVLITRLSQEKAARVQERFPLTYHDVCRIGLWGEPLPDTGNGTIVVCTGGTSDIPVSEEAAVVAEALGNRVARLYDVGVAGIHRLLLLRQPRSSPWPAWRAPWPALWAAWWTARSSRCPQASATAPPSAGSPPCCPCSTPAPAGSAS